ncbi:MAG TPA: iron-sulfur cluster assembly scaffold protein [Syntrophales bacterium]|nr:iron-sulfur cluster assembly scaffold protein [Syntrophales bacterium]HQB31098.1 iron-sulfur cluster assembly scaffold protein [Syntrophales bacterium]HQN79274.1 iron-sulfur cluster assembly scaffold protein [Syntrophales bacterium]HQQ28452.1 iron-sulfur cluster assembly scaffold protein [Syntrophales bacterium]
MENEEEIMARMMGLLEEKGTRRFSEAMMKHGMHPGCYGLLDRPDGYGKIAGSCGDTVEMFLRVRNGKVEEARFMTDGCFFTIAACDTAVSMAVGATLADCLKINQDAILKHLEKMPEDHVHCAHLAARAFHKALRDYVIRKKR